MEDEVNWIFWEFNSEKEAYVTVTDWYEYDASGRCRRGQVFS